MVYLLVFISVGAMTAAQLLLKKGLLVIGQSPQSLSELGTFFLKAYTNPYVISAVFLVLVTALAWIIVLSKAELGHIYPFMALTFILVPLFSVLLFSEDVSALKWVGIALICIGVFFVARS